MILVDGFLSKHKEVELLAYGFLLLVTCLLKSASLQFKEHEMFGL